MKASQQPLSIYVDEKSLRIAIVEYDSETGKWDVFGSRACAGFATREMAEYMAQGGAGTELLWKLVMRI